MTKVAQVMYIHQCVFFLSWLFVLCYFTGSYQAGSLQTAIICALCYRRHHGARVWSVHCQTPGAACSFWLATYGNAASQANVT